VTGAGMIIRCFSGSWAGESRTVMYVLSLSRKDRVMATGVSAKVPLFGVDLLRRGWGWFVALGILQIVLGVIAVGASVFVTLASVVLFGWLLLIGGVLSVVHAFWQKQWSGFFVDLAMGILYVVVGFMVVGNPLAAAETLTLLIAAFLFMGGIFRIVAALAGKVQNSFWVLLNGIVTLVLGIMIWRQWPLSGLWVIGLFIGIELIFYGWSLVMVGLTAKRLSSPANERPIA
jgi:uncharacterized membrane protein HdeD (DUF308 family)